MLTQTSSTEKLDMPTKSIFKIPLPLNPTPRELLVSVAGIDHEMHSISALARSKQAITLTCSCQKIFSLPNTPEHLKILRHVPMDAS